LKNALEEAVVEYPVIKTLQTIKTGGTIKFGFTTKEACADKY